VNSSGTNFVLLFKDQDDHWLLQKQGIEPSNRSTLDLPSHVLDPLFVNDQLITALFVESGGFKTQGGTIVACGNEDPECQPGQKYVIQADGNTIFSYVVIGPFAGFSLHGLWKWNEHWVLETDKTLLIDGKPAREDLGQLFRWDMQGGKPVYFYRSETQTGIVYDGNPVAVPYEYIVFEGYCCGNGRYNPTVFDDRVAFFARREGVWYYVEFGLQLF
jgi:hypothetical protein